MRFIEKKNENENSIITQYLKNKKISVIIWRLPSDAALVRPTWSKTKYAAMDKVKIVLP